MMKIVSNIKFKLLFILFILLFAIFYGFGYFFIHTLQTNYEKNIEKTLLAATRDLHMELVEKKNTLNSNEYLESINHIKAEFDLPHLYVQTINITNNSMNIMFKSIDLVFIDKTLPIDVDKMQTLHQNNSIMEVANLGTGTVKIIYTLFLKTDNSQDILICALPYEKHNPYIENIEKTLWISLSTLLIFILIVVYFLITQSLLTAQKLADDVNLIQIDGTFKKLQNTWISQEIDSLIATFNNLIKNLQSSYKKVKNFGQNASHELKTPLTIIRGEIEVGLRKERSNEEYKTILHSVVNELDQLQEVIENILFLSSNADEDLIKNFEEVYIDEIISDIIKEKTSLAKQKNLYMNILELTPLTTIGNQSLLKIAISNVIDNAIKYSKENQIINLTLHKDQLIIEDFGYGIPKNELEKVFERFYRINNHKQNIKGHGLGLSIVKSILDLHHFTIKIESIEGKGTKISIDFDR